MVNDCRDDVYGFNCKNYQNIGFRFLHFAYWPFFLFCQLYLNLLFQTLYLSPIFCTNNLSSSRKGRKFLYFFNYLIWCGLNKSFPPLLMSSLTAYPTDPLRPPLSFYIFIWFKSSLTVYDLLALKCTIFDLALLCLFANTEEISLPRMYLRFYIISLYGLLDFIAIFSKQVEFILASFLYL
jgi:hypothetical protein